jgi:bifunctional NMN adenylyltransferase/nudix hydrolase
MPKPYKLAVLIGRFQPFHRGHEQVMLDALSNADRLLVMVGSSNLSRTTRNPFSYEERESMIMQAMCDKGVEGQVEIIPLSDNPYELQSWITSVQNHIKSLFPFGNDKDVAITGHERDQSSFYLKQFPQWGFIQPKIHSLHINATEIREVYFGSEGWFDMLAKNWLPKSSLEFLIEFTRGHHFKDICAEKTFEVEYRKRWGKGPFQTVDPVVIQSGHLLTVIRKDAPGKGMLALPGGHVEYGETCDAAVIRELFEETRIHFHVKNKDLRVQRIWQGFRGRRRFDDPARSCRAHVITEAFLFKLPDYDEFPSVLGADDAEIAMWTPLSELRSHNMFEDHFWIVQKMISTYL